MRFLILGAGALGGYFGAKLLKGGVDVEFLVRSGRAAQLAENGLVVTGVPEGDIRMPVTVVLAGQIRHAYDVILLPCKAFDLSDAIASIAPAIGPNTSVFPMLNGVKHIEILTERFGQEHVLGGLTWESGTLTPNGDIVRAPLAAKIGMTTLGELNGQLSDRCRAILEAFVAGGLKTNTSDTIMADMWTKFATFVSSATIATLCRSRSGAIAVVPTAAAFVSAVLEECDRVVSAEGYSMPESSIALVRDLYSHPGSQYGPSIIGDMERNQRTEAEHTIGDMVDRAKRHGISAPILTAARCNLEVYEVLRANA